MGARGEEFMVFRLGAIVGEVVQKAESKLRTSSFLGTVFADCGWWVGHRIAVRAVFGRYGRSWNDRTFSLPIMSLVR